jgi:tetratricopeptide (TPR) repeat protein
MLKRQSHLPALFAFFATVTVAVCPMAFFAQPPPSVPALNSEGIRALNAGDLPKALRDFLSAQQADPNNTDVAFNLGLTYFRLGRYKEAVAPLHRVVAAGTAPDKALYLLGVTLYQTGDFDAAVEQFEILRGRSSQHQDEILYLLEESYRRGKKPRQAKDCFTELESKYPSSCFLHKLMGTAYGEQGHDDQALSEFKQAIALNPAIGDVHRAIGIIYFNRQNNAEAAEWFKQELALNPCDPASHYYLGEIARNSGQTPIAADEYKKAIGCDANYAEGHLGMGMVLVAQNQNLRALEEFREAARLEPENSQVHYQLARSLQRAGKAHEAAVEVEIVKRLEAIDNAKAAAKQH